MRASGRTVKDMVSALKPEAGGFIEVNGPRVLKVAMVFDNRTRRLRNTKVHGQMDFKMDTDRKHMPTMVSSRNRFM